MTDTTTDEVEISTVVNGNKITATLPARMTLAEFLRDRLGLTGTKVSCEMQVCGVCTVLVDGLPISSCTFLAAESDGRRIETVESLSSGSQLHPIQKSFIEHSALQCGFCTGGFEMMTKSLLDSSNDVTRDSAIEYLKGNICRCTGYAPIVDAVMDVADNAVSERHG